MKRIREVYSTNEIPHLWAHQLTPNGVSHARNPQGNFYYNGDTIYSYGGHFPIARLLRKNKKSEPYVLITTRTYSSTTSGHVSSVHHAVKHLKVFWVHDINLPEESFKDRQQDLKSLLKQARETRSVVRAMNCLKAIEDTVRDINDWRQFMKRRSRVTVPAEVEEMRTKLLPRYQKHQDRVEKARQAKQEARRLQYERWEREHKEEEAERQRWSTLTPEQQDAEFATKLIQWETGEISTRLLPDRMHRTPYLRVRREHTSNAIVETTLGALVPLPDVARIWEKIKQVLQTGMAWKATGDDTLKVGHYYVNTIQADGSLSIGCHQFTAEAILRFAAKLGWYVTPESAASSLAA